MRSFNVSRGLAALAAAALFAGSAFAAQISENIFVITAQQGTESTTWFFSEPGGVQGSSYDWALDSDVAIGGEGSGFGTLQGGINPETSLPYTSVSIGTPAGAGGGGSALASGSYVVNLNFAVSAGAADTTFTVSSAVVTLDSPMSGAEGRASAGFGVTDSSLNFANGSMTSSGLLPGMYRAQTNGIFPGASTFYDGFSGTSITTPGDFTSANDSFDFPGAGSYAAIAGTVTDMSSIISFTLTAGDQGNGTSTFEIVPEPTSALLLVVGLGLIRRR